jgi:hypothetical protein
MGPQRQSATIHSGHFKPFIPFSEDAPSWATLEVDVVKFKQWVYQPHDDPHCNDASFEPITRVAATRFPLAPEWRFRSGAFRPGQKNRAKSYRQVFAYDLLTRTLQAGIPSEQHTADDDLDVVRKPNMKPVRMPDMPPLAFARPPSAWGTRFDQTWAPPKPLAAPANCYDDSLDPFIVRSPNGVQRLDAGFEGGSWVSGKTRDGSVLAAHILDLAVTARCGQPAGHRSIALTATVRACNSTGEPADYTLLARGDSIYIYQEAARKAMFQIRKQLSELVASLPRTCDTRD